MEYAVVITYSFDDDVIVHLFSDEGLAKKFLKDSYHEELRIDREENGWDVDGSISDDGWSAKITDHFWDRDDVTEFRIAEVNR